MKERFNCDQCGKNFTIGCNLKVFIQIVEFNCDHCGRNFTQNTGLKLQISAAVYENLFCSMMQFENSHTKCS